MANARIKGITIELNGDVTKLNNALSSSEKQAQNATKSLREIERALKFNPGNAKLVEQQQRNLAEAITATKDKLKVLRDADEQMKQQLNDGKISVEQYETFQREIITTESQLQNYEKRLGSSQEEQGRLETATGNLAKIFEASGTSVDDFADILGQDVVDAFKKGEGSSEQMEGALQKLGDELLGTGGDSELLQENLDRLGEGTSFDQLQQEARDAGAKISDMGDSAEEADKDIGNINDNAIKIVGLDAAIDLFGKLKDAIGDAMGAVMDAWGKIDEGQDTIIAKTGASGDAAEAMGKVFSDVYGSMPAESQEVGDAIGELNTQFGLQGDALDDATRQLLMYKEINGTDVTQSVQSAKKAMDQFGLSAEDLGSVLDITSKAGQDTGVNVDKLLDTVSRGAPALQGMGLSFEESVVAMSQFEQSGIDGSKALSYLTKAQSTAAKDGKTLTEALDEFTEIATSSQSETDKLNAATELFGSKGGAMMIKAAQDGHLNFDKLKDSVGSAGDTVKNTYNEMLDPIDQVTVAQHNLDEILGDIGSTIQDAAAPAIDGLVGFLQMLKDGFASLSPDVKTAIVVIAGIVTAFLGVVAVIATLQTAFGLIGPIIANVTGIFSGLGGAISGLFTFVAANPIVLIIAAIVAAVAFLITHWDEVKAVAQAVWDKIVEVWQGILDFIGPILDAIGSALSDAWDGIKTTVENVWNGISDFITGIWDAISTTISSVIDGISTTISDVLNAIQTTINNIWDGIKSVTSDVWNGIKDTVCGVWDGIKDGVTNAINTVRDTIGGIWDGIKSKTEDVWNGIKSAIQAPIEAARDLVQGAIDTIKGFFDFEFTWPHIPLPHFSFSGSINPFSGDFPPRLNIDWYKQGGIFDSPKLIGVGEAGSEAVLPTHKLDAFLADAVERVLQEIAPQKAQTAGGVAVYVDGLVVREEADLERIAALLYQKIKREGRRM